MYREEGRWGVGYTGRRAGGGWVHRRRAGGGWDTQGRGQVGGGVHREEGRWDREEGRWGVGYTGRWAGGVHREVEGWGTQGGGQVGGGVQINLLL